MNQEDPAHSAQASDQEILHALSERAKELNCLYRIDELLRQGATPLPDVLRGLVEVLPPGYQYPAVCEARVQVGELVAETPGFRRTAWMQRASVVADGETVGMIEAAYREPITAAGSDPFLKEEQRLIDTIAQRLGSFLAHRRLQTSLEALAEARKGLAQGGSGQWQVILDFLRSTDQTLFTRISRKMLNHLCRIGIPAAVELLHQGMQGPAAEAASEVGDDNRPSETWRSPAQPDITGQVFAIANQHLSEKEILVLVQQWIRQDRARFFVNVVASPESSLDEVTEAIRRLHRTPADQIEFSAAVEHGLRVALIERFFTDQPSYIKLAKRFIDIGDFHDLAEHMVFPPRSRGKLGGKSAGLFLAMQVLRKTKDRPPALGELKMPRTWYITSDGIIDFMRNNNLEDIYNQKYAGADQIRQEYPHIVQMFKSSSFSPDMIRGLAMILDDLQGAPLIVRSSSLLEDRFDAAFSGKYKSLFLANVGTKQERLTALVNAIAEVYASVFAPDPIEYRAERDLLDTYEEMGIMVQEVVGTRVGKYFLPAFSGVAFSRNEFRWSARIRREDGLLRLVPGLGTRAVDRLKDDYPVLMAPGQPSLRVNVTLDEVIRYSPKKIDVIDLEARSFASVAIPEFLAAGGSELPQLEHMVSIVEEDRIRRPVGREVTLALPRCVFTFEGVAASTPFIRQIRAMLEVLERELGIPVDLEFASDGRDLYLLQCRPQSSAGVQKAAPIPQGLPEERILFTAKRFVSNGSATQITHLVYIDPDGYNALASVEDLKRVGRAVGRLNRILPKRQFMLIGPGRWGSRGDIRLGVNVTYADLSNTAVLVEVARKKGNYVPDLSFGTHFFQDLVEASIHYLPLYPDEPEIAFNEAFLRNSPNILGDLLSEFRDLAPAVKVIDVPKASGGMVVEVRMNGDQERAVAFLAPPAVLAEDGAPTGAEPSRPENHWRWRLTFAERLAANLDPERFGVNAIYLFGSTKNATAGPASDIDLLVHFHGSEAQRRELHRWLEGWSACLSELNFLRTGYRTSGLLDVHLVSDEDIARQTSFAAKIGAVTDPARPLPLGGAQSK